MKLETTGSLFSQQSSSRRQVEKKSFKLHQESSSSKYHRAAIDGYIDMLCEASKRDTNLASELNGSLTPTLLAAQNGHLEALRILVGRGGDPERTSSTGASALHLAAARNHLNCVSFLVNFGVNMWALDNELHTAKDVAAMAQRKEVLDYLDQMMAKQSALNTKNVQKLKEKAKVGAEKRLKRMRKAQMKAIKRAEKDERYLAKLSNSRRLLKAAHSISDIKLVGRPGDSNNFMGGQQATNETAAKSGRLVSSPSLANFLNHKLHMDLLGQRQRAQHQQQHQGKQIGFSSLFGSSAGGSVAHSDSQSSAYSSASVSTASGYLSCSSAGALARSSHHLDQLASSSSYHNHQKQQQPKYSDLVAVPTANNNVTEQQSLKSSSNSTLAGRLWGMAGGGGGGGGVSRKVQLKRMLLATTNSTSDLYASSSTNQGETTAKNQHLKQQQQQQPKRSDGDERTTAPKLCNVQPAIKLKLGGSNGSGQQQADQGIKWPPAPAMTRAISEPDFGAHLRDDDDDDDEDSASSSACSLVDLRSLTDENEEDKEDEDKSDRMNGANKPDRCQHQLLTQCLSQLKQRHRQAIEAAGQEETLRPSRVAAAQRRARLEMLKAASGGAGQAAHSDELLQLRQCVQLHSDAPLKPSAIKLQQQQQQQQQLKQPPDANNNNSNEISGSVSESIGSAGSFCHRNSLGSSNSSSPSAYSSTYASSIELVKVVEPADPHQLPPPPPPLPPPPPPPPLAQTQKHRKAATTLEAFLAPQGLTELVRVFEAERIDLEALMLLSEEDLKSLNILLGPRRKLLKAIEDRRAADLSLNQQQQRAYLMLDTPL